MGGRIRVIPHIYAVVIENVFDSYIFYVKQLSKGEQNKC